MSGESPGIRYLDGERLRRAMIAGAIFVADRAEPLNRINVFPVPDGDTGTNMALTLTRVAERVADLRGRHAGRVARSIADEAVAGARGNSGAILAQFLTGFSEAMPDSARIDTADFGRAVVRGAESAESAVQRPQEGTILTVLRDWARNVAEHAAQVRDFGRLLSDSLKAARESLSRTPEKLAALKKAGVVDAGAQGFVYLVEGIVAYIAEAARRVLPQLPKDSTPASFDLAPESILFRYCTEALLESVDVGRETVRGTLALLGDSIVIAGGSSRMRVHIHTNEPEKLFSELAAFGVIAQTKVEDMRRQHEEHFDQSRSLRTAIVTDSACDLPEAIMEEHGIQVVPLRLHFARENFLDRVTISAHEFYARWAVNGGSPKTSQPPAADFRQVYEALAEHHGSILTIHVSSGLSGTYQAAVTASRGIAMTKIVPVDSRNVSVAEGFVVRAAAEALARGASATEAAAAALEVAGRIRIFIAVPTLEHAVRGGRVSPTRGWISRVLGLRPVLTMNSEGKAEPVAVAFGWKATVRKTLKLALKTAEGSETPKFGIVHADARESAEALGREIRSRYPSCEVTLLECSPVLGAHAGPGALGIAVLASASNPSI